MQSPFAMRALAAGVAVTLVALVQAAGALALSGAAPLSTSGSSAVEAASGSRSVVLTLAPSDPDALRSLAADAAKPRLAPGEFTQRFAPAQSTVSAVEAWAQAHGLQTNVSPDRLLVTLTGPTSALGGALGVSFERFRAHDGGSYVSSTGTAKLPSSLAKHVLAITGLSSLERAQAAVVRRSGASPTPGLEYPTSYGPKELWSLYHAPAGQTGSRQQVSVIAAGDLSQPKADLATFEKRFGLPSVTWNQIDVGKPSAETEGDDEWDLDTQYSTGFAPGVSQVNVYDGSSLEDPAILETIDRWVTDDPTSQASFSAGECELLADAAGFLESLDTVLAEAAAQGQTLFVASGDTGSQCPALVGVNGLPLGLPGVNYPASSPFAIGAGGTTVLAKGDEPAGTQAAAARACSSPPPRGSKAPAAASWARSAACPT
jgi:pseudomonalisin